MEEERKSADPHSKIRKSSAFKVPSDPSECWGFHTKDKSRQFSSVSRMRNRVIHHDSSSPIEDDKTLLKIQKKLEALSTVQTSINQDLKLFSKCPSAVSPPRQLSARRVRKGVIYRPSEKMRHNIVELYTQQPCAKCRTAWVSNFPKATCELCSSPSTLAFELELRVQEGTSDAVLVIGEKEIPITLNSRFKCIVKLMNMKEIKEKNNTFDIEINHDLTEYTRVTTPSFQLNTERIFENSTLSNNGSNLLPGEISFSDNSKYFQDIYTELDSLMQKQFKVLESPSLSKIKEVCDGISNEYQIIFKKIASCAFYDIAQAVEKTQKGFLAFFDSCIVSLIKYISQLQDKNALAKDTEQKYVVRIASLTKLLQKYQENPYSKKFTKVG